MNKTGRPSGRPFLIVSTHPDQKVSVMKKKSACLFKRCPPAIFWLLIGMFASCSEDAVPPVVYTVDEIAAQGLLVSPEDPWVLAKALMELYGIEVPVKVIGTRHGEKLYETLCTREEMAKAIDLDGFYQVPADNRDLNYGKYFEEGDVKTSELEDYNSHNTTRLNIEEVKEKLLSLEYVREELKLWNEK